MIIIFGFANFFYIMNLNALNAKDDSGKSVDMPYVDDYGLYGIANAVINAYLISLGEFGLDNYGNEAGGLNRFLVWIFFVLATFLMLIVFMNMLIAIMGDTFGNVQAVAEENALMEQALMINDYIELVNLGEIFKN